MKLKIITFPNPLLKKKSLPIKKIDSRIKKLIEDMIDTLENKEEGNPIGVGLSAPQIGQLLRVIVVWSKSSKKFLPMVNPEIIWHSQQTKLGVPESENPYEGCLSVPGVWGKVKRFSSIKVAYQTPAGRKLIKKFKGFICVVIQHEIDHLDGILFIDRILKQKGKIYKQEKDKNGKEIFVEAKFA